MLKILMILTMTFTSIIRTERITILTQPVQQPTNEHWYHPAVTNSLLRGLQKLGVDFNFNPSKISDVGSTVVVLTNLDALQEAIQWKQTGRIKKLLSGPNFAITPTHYAKMQEIDTYLVPSDWIKRAYTEKEPSLQNKVKSWPAGVDENYWNPKVSFKNRSCRNILIYTKINAEEFYDSVKNLVKKYRWNPVRITYGQYTHQQYRAALEQAQFAIFLSRSESQGIGLLEAWAMDVPTLVWNPGKSLTYEKIYFKNTSSCPYLTDQTGKSWKTLQDLEDILLNLASISSTFSARDWLLANMTDTLAAKILLSYIFTTP